MGKRPLIRKMGTIDCDMVETTPVVFRDRLYRFEYVRSNYKPNQTGVSYFRFIDVDSGQPSPAFAMSSAHIQDDTVFVYGVNAWGGSELRVFWSDDLETWLSQTALNLPGWKIYNNSVCKGEGRYLMAFEIGAPPEEAGVPFTIRFAESSDLLHLEAMPCPTYEPYIVRSQDLVHWQSSPLNPILLLPSRDDCGYPGLVVENDRVLMSFYSQHDVDEVPETKPGECPSDIYLAEIIPQ